MKKGTTDRHLLICFLFTGIILILIHIIFSNLEKRMKEEKKESLEKQEIYLDDTLIVTGGDEDTPMCMTWTTAEGEAVWEGITPEAYEKTSGAERKEFSNWYNKYIEDQCYQSTLAIAYEETPYEYFSDLCRDYSGLIPYLKDGREYGVGFLNIQDLYKERPIDSERIGIGLDSFGYIIWLYRNTFGFTPAGLYNLSSLLERSKEVTADDLRIGDICLYSLDENTCYGVIAGFYDEDPVVSYCDSKPTRTFKNGCTRLSYIKSVTNSYFMEMEPQEFNFFLRLNLDWEGIS